MKRLSSSQLGAANDREHSNISCSSMRPTKIPRPISKPSSLLRPSPRKCRPYQCPTTKIPNRARKEITRGDNQYSSHKITQALCPSSSTRPGLVVSHLSRNHSVNESIHSVSSYYNRNPENRPDVDTVIPDSLPPSLLPNPNNLCYRNAPLQLLLNSPVFLTYLTRFHIPEEYEAPIGQDWREGRFSLLYDLSRLSKAYWSENLPNREQSKKMSILRIDAAAGCIQVRHDATRIQKHRKFEIEKGLFHFWRHVVEGSDGVNTGWIPWIPSFAQRRAIYEEECLSTANCELTSQAPDATQFLTWLFESIMTQLAGRAFDDNIEPGQGAEVLIKSAFSPTYPTSPQLNFATLTALTLTPSLRYSRSICPCHETGHVDSDDIVTPIIHLNPPIILPTTSNYPTVTLSHCLKQYTTREVPNFRCTICDSVDDTTSITLTVKEAPELLFISLNPFQPTNTYSDNASSRQVKLPSRVAIDPDLDLTEFYHNSDDHINNQAQHDSVSGAYGISKSSEDERDNDTSRTTTTADGRRLRYKLRGIVHHHGKVKRGRYKTFVRRDVPVHNDNAVNDEAESFGRYCRDGDNSNSNSISVSLQEGIGCYRTKSQPQCPATRCLGERGAEEEEWWQIDDDSVTRCSFSDAVAGSITSVVMSSNHVENGPEDSKTNCESDSIWTSVLVLYERICHEE